MKLIFALFSLIAASATVSAAVVANPKRTAWVKGSDFRTTHEIKGRQCQTGDYVYGMEVSRTKRNEMVGAAPPTGYGLYRVKIYCRNQSGSSKYTVGASGFIYKDTTTFVLPSSPTGIKKVIVNSGEIIDGIRYGSATGARPSNSGTPQTVFTATNIIGVEWATKPGEPDFSDIGPIATAIRFLYI